MLHSMFSSHSASSSPDILAPPGDADYLISSPFRPFSGRQSSLMSPANRRILQTPGAAKRKRSRISLSPAKSAHSIRFDDIVLPGSPTRKLNGRQRSLSPDKAQEDGNVSPWRIRVTLEATQDEQENQGSPSRKKPKPTTTTTKIPLKDTSEQTPRRRGRPRKSGALDATPPAGSPGNTPGPGNSEQKRRRGRPRKHRPESDAIKGNEQPEVDAQVVDPAPAGTELERRSWSPLNLAGDADSDDGLYDNQPLDIPFEAPSHTDPPETIPTTEDQKPSPTFERTYDTPNGDVIDRFHSVHGDDDLHSTPSKMPLPTRDRQGLSPENSMYAGHTPMPPRTYPSPTSSPLVGDEIQGRNQTARESSTSVSRPSTARNTDPTNEHREFDSIMESEGFSMVSLDTLPSANQHGMRNNPDIAKGPLKPFIERETNGVLRRKTNILERPREEISATNPNPDAASTLKGQLDASQPRASSQAANTKRVPFSPIPSERSSPIPQRKPLLRLAKLVRAGIALERVLSHSNTPYSPGNPVPDYMGPRQRLEVIFSDLNPDSQRVLGAALGLGQVLAIRRKMMELRSPQRRALVEEELKEDGLDVPDFPHTTSNGSRTPNRQYDGAADSSPAHSSPSSEMKRRFAEWQKEREAISRTIQMANSSQVIVIDSDGGTPSPAAMNNGEVDHPDLSCRIPTQAEHHEELEEGDYDEYREHSADETPRITRQEEQQQEQEELEGHSSEDRDYGVNRSRHIPWQDEEQWQDDVVEEDYGNDEEGGHDVNRSPQIPWQEEEQRQEDMVEDEPGNEEGGGYGVNQSPRVPWPEEDHEGAEEEDFNVEGGDNGVDADVDDDDGYEDIWQEQAKDEGNSGRESMLEPQDGVQSSPWKGGSTPADREHGTSPAYWMVGQSKVPFSGKSRIRELREQNVDISPLLRAEDTPNRVRYYYGKSSPVSTAQGRSPQHNLSSAASQRRKDAESYEVEPDEIDAVPEEPEDPEDPEKQADYLDFSPEKDLEDETFQIDPTTRHESEMQRHQSDFADNTSISDDADEEPAVHEAALTPKNPEPAYKDGQASSWYQKITSLTPGWLKAPTQNPSPQHKQSSLPTNHSVSEDSSLSAEQSEEEEDNIEQVREQEDVRGNGEAPPDAESESDIGERASPNSQPKSARASVTPRQEQKAKAPEIPPQPRLATSGYFSNAHYTLLRRLYRLAKQSPESFPYHPSAAHSDIIGDYIWTSDNIYGVPITELQFAIVYRFRQELAAEDLNFGGTGWVGWTEADLHRRLVSVIIGEQIREDRKNALDLRPTRSRPRSILQRC
ncbi:hypothetical protein BDW62DRAFT_173746 [Aspergillus aurantiobrunneus]